MFKNIDFYIKTRCMQGVRGFFPEQECNLVTKFITKFRSITVKIVYSAHESI